MLLLGRTDSKRCWRTAPRKLLIAVAILMLSSMGVAVSKFVAADVDEPLVELLPLLWLLSILDS